MDGRQFEAPADDVSIRAQALLDLFEYRPALWVALRRVSEHPQQELRMESPFVSVGEAHSLDASMLARSAGEPGSLATTIRMAHFAIRDEKWRFLRVYDRRIVRFEDTVANRFVAFFVRYAVRLLREFAYGLPKTGALGELFPVFLRIIRRLNAVFDALSPAFKYGSLSVLPIDHPFLQFDSSYHVILETYLACESL